MMMNRLNFMKFPLNRASISIGLLLLAIAGTPAFADIVFTTSGTTSGGSVAGTADFKVVGSEFDITLSNTTTTVDAIAKVLDGLSFTQVGGTGLALTSVAASGFEDCTGSSCTSSTQFFYTTGTTLHGPINSPYLWGYTSPVLAAGSGSYKPAGIVNGSITNLDGIPNAEHNDYLMGPVTFKFSFTTAPTNVTAATFYWGTTPETTNGTSDGGGNITGSVPEPTSIALLGGVLLFSARAFRRKRRIL